MVKEVASDFHIAGAFKQFFGQNHPFPHQWSRSRIDTENAQGNDIGKSFIGEIVFLQRRLRHLA